MGPATSQLKCPILNRNKPSAILWKQPISNAWRKHILKGEHVEFGVVDIGRQHGIKSLFFKVTLSIFFCPLAWKGPLQLVVQGARHVGW